MNDQYTPHEHTTSIAGLAGSSLLRFMIFFSFIINAAMVGGGLYAYHYVTTDQEMQAYIAQAQHYMEKAERMYNSLEDKHAKIKAMEEKIDKAMGRLDKAFENVDGKLADKVKEAAGRINKDTRDKVNEKLKKDINKKLKEMF